MDSSPKTTSLHPLLVSGHSYAGKVFTYVLCDVVFKADHRKVRGFTETVLDKIAAGLIPVSQETLQQLLVDYNVAYPKRVASGNAHYLFLKSIANNTWKKTAAAKKEETTTVTVVPLIIRQQPLAPIEYGIVLQSRSAVQQRAIVTSVRVDSNAPKAFSSDKPLPRIVIPLKPTSSEASTKSKPAVNQSDTLPVASILKAVKVHLSKKVPAKKVLKPSPTFHAMMRNPKPKKEKVVRVPRKPKVQKEIESREDLPERKHVFAILDQATIVRFWTNLSEVLAIKECSVANLLRKINMPPLFFVELQEGQKVLTAAQVTRFAKALEVDISSLLGEL